MVGNQRSFAQQLSGQQGGGTFAAPPPSQSPFMQNLMGVAAMGMQPGAMPGSPQQQMQSQQMGMGVLSMAVSEQTPILGALFQNMQGQQAFNQQLQQNFTFARPGGFGFNMQQMQGVNQAVSQQAQQNPMWSQQQMRGVAGMGMQMGMFKGTRDVYEFQNQFRQLVRSAEQITKVLGGTLEEGVQAIARMRGMGVFKQADQMQMMKTLPGMAAASGTSVGQLQQFGGQVAQMLRPMGVQAAAGAGAGMQALGTVGIGQQMGVIDESQIWQATGMSGVAGQQALAGRIMQTGAKFTKRTGGKIMMAAFVDPNSGAFDTASWTKFQSGQMSFGEMQGQARSNIKEMGGYLSWQQKEGEIRGEFMEGTQGMGGLFAMRKAYEKHWDDPRKAQLIARRRLGFSREEAPGVVALMQNLPEIMREQEYASKIAEQQSERQEAWQSRSPQARMQAGLKSLKQKALGGVEKAMGTFVDSFTTAMTRGMEDYTGNVEAQISRGFMENISRQTKTRKGAQSLHERAVTYKGIAERARALKPDVGAGSWADVAGTFLGEGATELKKMMAGIGMTATTPEELSKWGIGGDVLTTEGAAAAFDIAQRSGRGDITVVAGQKGFGVIKGGAQKQRRIAQLSGAKIDLKDFGLTETDANRIMTGTLPREVREAVQAGDYDKAESLITERASLMGTPVKGHQARILAIDSARKQGVEVAPYMTLGGAGGTYGQMGGNAIGALTKYGAERSSIEEYLQDPAYQDLFLKAAKGDRGAVAEARQKARDEGKIGMADFLGEMEQDWGKASGAFGQAAAGVNLEAMKKQADTRKDFARKYTEGFKKRWEKPGQMAQTRLSEILGAISGGEKMQALAEGEVTGLGAGEEMAETIRQYGGKWTPQQMKETAGMLREQGYGEAAEEMEAQVGYQRKARRKKRQVVQGAAKRLADLWGIEGKKERAQFFKKAQQGKIVSSERMARYEGPEEEERVGLLKEAITEKGAEGAEARARLLEVQEEENAAKRANATAGNPETVRLHGDTIKALETSLTNAVAKGMSANVAGAHEKLAGDIVDSVSKIVEQKGGEKP